MDIGRQRQYGSLGGHRGWANTEDRAARLTKAQRNSPVGVTWHARRLFPGVDLDMLTPAQWKRAESARRAYFAEFALKGRAAREAKKRASGASA